MNRRYVCFALATLSIVLAIACVVAAVTEGNTNTFNGTFAVHNVLLWVWTTNTIFVLVLSRFRWPYFLLLIFAPLAIWPIPTWMFILFRVLRMQFAP